MSHRGLFNTNHRLSLAARDSPGQLRDTHGSYTDSPHTDTRRLARRLGRHLADTWQTLGRHAQTRGTLRPAWHWQTRRRLEAHLADKAQTRGTPRETLRVHTLGFRQEAGKRGDTLTRAEDVQKAIFPVTPLFAYFLYTQIYKNRSQ